MKTKICIIKRTHADNRVGCILEIGGIISINLDNQKAQEVIRNANLELHESYNEPDIHSNAVKVELFY